MCCCNCFCCFFVCCHWRSYVVACCHLSLLRVPHTLELGPSPLLSFMRSLLLNLFPFPCCCIRGLFCVGLLPKCHQVPLVVVCWSSPGCFQDHCSATMRRFEAASLVSALAVRAFCLLGSDLLIATGRPQACCTRMPCWRRKSGAG